MIKKEIEREIQRQKNLFKIVSFFRIPMHQY